MRVPLLDLSEQYRSLAGPLRAEIDEILASQQFILGPKVEEFEAAMAHYCGSRHAIGVSSGTDALLAILMALGIGPGHAVVTTAYTFFATAGCVARVGALPVFVDIEPDTFNISPAALEEFLAGCERNEAGRPVTTGGREIAALVPVHLFGLCAEMEALCEIARRYHVVLIEDAAQAIGAEYASGPVSGRAGAMGFAGYFSFYPSKNLGAAGDAGLVVTDDEAFAARLRVCRQHGMEPRYFHHFIGGNFRLDGIQAAILQVKLPWLDRWSAQRRDAADFYRAEFSRHGLEEVVRLPVEPYRAGGLANHHIYHQFVIRTERRDALQQHLTKREIGTAIYYPLGLHEQECFREICGPVALPETERAARETLALPMFPELTREQQRCVVAAVAEFFERA